MVAIHRERDPNNGGVTSSCCDMNSPDRDWSNDWFYFKVAREMEEIRDDLHSIRRTISMMWVILGLYSIFLFFGALKETFLDISSFDKYIEFEWIDIYNAELSEWLLTYDSTTNRVVSIADSYKVYAQWEVICDSGEGFDIRGNISETRVLDASGNPSVNTKGGKNDGLRVEKWDDCYIRYNLTINNGFEDKEKTIETSTFTVN